MNIEGLVRGKTGSSDNMVVSHSSQAPAENNRNCQKECDCKTRRRVVVKDCSEKNQIPYICRHNHARQETYDCRVTSRPL
jgi:hypothetical protein